MAAPSKQSTRVFRLLKGNVFSKDHIESYLELKQEEQDRFRMAPHPVEFDMYYSC